MAVSISLMRSNIWRTVACATDQEIRDGISFYPGAHGLCHLLSLALSRPHLTVSPSQIAGMYAALSPMNTWDTNVSNIVDVIRDGTAASVNTTDINLHKALAILHGSAPESVLAGSKVRAFYAAINDPDDTTPIPIDRHLINCAVGCVAPSKREQGDMANDPHLYARIERVYSELGRREGMGNRLSSIAWFVQRRLERTGQRPIPHPDLVCCGQILQSHGTKPRRLRCGVCGRTRHAQPRQTPKSKLGTSSVLYDQDLPIQQAQLYVRGARPQVYLGKGHPYATTSGVNWLSRFVVMYRTGERLHRDEHVHHCNGNKLDCQTENLKVMLAGPHGRLHARKQLLYMLRDRLGRWAPSEVPAWDGEPVPF